MAQPVWIEVNGERIEAMPWTEGDYLVRGNEPGELRGLFPSSEGYWLGESAPFDAVEGAVEAARYFWLPDNIFQRYSSMVEKMFNGAGDLSPDSAMRAAVWLSSPSLFSSSIIAEVAKKRFFYGARNLTSEQAEQLASHATERVANSQQNLDIFNPKHMTKLHAILGITGEAHEVLIEWDNPEKLKLELGDVVFYVQALAALSGFGLKEILEANIEKLETRYPEGWPKS